MVETGYAHFNRLVWDSFKIDGGMRIENGDLDSPENEPVSVSVVKGIKYGLVFNTPNSLWWVWHFLVKDSKV